MSKASEDQYDIGYGKPPKSTRFQKGVSGNPGGRPKGSLDFDEQLLREASLPVVINENGRQIRISKQEVVIRQLMHKAMKGEAYAVRTFIGQHRQAIERAALLIAQQKAKSETLKDFDRLTDEELEALIRDSMEKEKK
jgi:hypothetical protein